MRVASYVVTDQKGNLAWIEETFVVTSRAEFRLALLSTTPHGLQSATLRIQTLELP